MKTIKDYENIVKDNDGKTFWEKQDEDYKAHPEDYRKYNETVVAAKKTAADWMKIAQNPANEDAYNKWRMNFNSDPQNVIDHYVKTMTELSGAKSLILKDVNYENRLKTQYTDKNGKAKKYSPDTFEDAHVLKHFQDTISAKHQAVGYDGDEDAVKEYWQNYSLSTL